MKKKKILLLISFLLVLSACDKQKKKKTTKKEDIEVSVNVLKFNLEPKSSSTTSGQVIIKDSMGIVTFSATLKGLTPGEHAIHIHEKSDCSSPDGKSTGGHWNPTHAKHGKWGSNEFHRGDIGNFTADETGKAFVELTTDLWCLSCDDETKNIIGKAVIVHAKADDYITQPTGNAGGRISCAGIVMD